MPESGNGIFQSLSEPTLQRSEREPLQVDSSERQHRSLDHQPSFQEADLVHPQADSKLSGLEQQNLGGEDQPSSVHGGFGPQGLDQEQQSLGLQSDSEQQGFGQNQISSGHLVQQGSHQEQRGLGHQSGLEQQSLGQEQVGLGHAGLGQQGLQQEQRSLGNQSGSEPQGFDQNQISFGHAGLVQEGLQQEQQSPGHQSGSEQQSSGQEQVILGHTGLGQQGLHQSLGHDSGSEQQSLGQEQVSLDHASLKRQDWHQEPGHRSGSEQRSLGEEQVSLNHASLKRQDWHQEPGHHSGSEQRSLGEEQVSLNHASLKRQDWHQEPGHRSGSEQLDAVAEQQTTSSECDNAGLAEQSIEGRHGHLLLGHHAGSYEPSYSGFEGQAAGQVSSSAGVRQEADVELFYGNEVRKGSSNDEDDDDFQQFGDMSDDEQSPGVSAGITAWAVPSHSVALPRDVPPQKAGPVGVKDKNKNWESEVSLLPDNTVTTPLDNTVTTPTDSTAAALPDNAVTTLPDNTVTAPPDNTVTTLPDNTVTTPPDSTVTTPLDSTVNTPPDNTVTAPPMTTHPDNTVTTHPDSILTTPPDSILTTPPDSILTTHPDSALTTPPDNTVTTPQVGLLATPGRALTASPQEGILTTPPQEGVQTTPSWEGVLTSASLSTAPPQEGVPASPGVLTTSSQEGIPTTGVLTTLPQEGVLATPPQEGAPPRESTPLEPLPLATVWGGAAAVAEDHNSSPSLNMNDLSSPEPIHDPLLSLPGPSEDAAATGAYPASTKSGQSGTLDLDFDNLSVHSPAHSAPYPVQTSEADGDSGMFYYHPPPIQTHVLRMLQGSDDDPGVWSGDPAALSEDPEMLLEASGRLSGGHSGGPGGREGDPAVLVGGEGDPRGHVVDPVHLGGFAGGRGWGQGATMVSPTGVKRERLEYLETPKAPVVLQDAKDRVEEEEEEEEEEGEELEGERMKFPILNKHQREMEEVESINNLSAESEEDESSAESEEDESSAESEGEGAGEGVTVGGGGVSDGSSERVLLGASLAGGERSSDGGDGGMEGRVVRVGGGGGGEGVAVGDTVGGVGVAVGVVGAMGVAAVGGVAVGVAGAMGVAAVGGMGVAVGGAVAGLGVVVGDTLGGGKDAVGKMGVPLGGVAVGSEGVAEGGASGDGLFKAGRDTLEVVEGGLTGAGRGAGKEFALGGSMRKNEFLEAGRGHSELLLGIAKGTISSESELSSSDSERRSDSPEEVPLGRRKGTRRKRRRKRRTQSPQSPAESASSVAVPPKPEPWVKGDSVTASTAGGPAKARAEPKSKPITIATSVGGAFVGDPPAEGVSVATPIGAPPASLSAPSTVGPPAEGAMSAHSGPITTGSAKGEGLAASPLLLQPQVEGHLTIAKLSSIVPSSSSQSDDHPLPVTKRADISASEGDIRIRPSPPAANQMTAIKTRVLSQDDEATPLGGVLGDTLSPSGGEISSTSEVPMTGDVSSSISSIPRGKELPMGVKVLNPRRIGPGEGGNSLGPPASKMTLEFPVLNQGPVMDYLSRKDEGGFPLSNDREVSDYQGFLCTGILAWERRWNFNGYSHLLNLLYNFVRTISPLGRIAPPSLCMRESA